MRELGLRVPGLGRAIELVLCMVSYPTGSKYQYSSYVADMWGSPKYVLYYCLDPLGIEPQAKALSLQFTESCLGNRRKPKP